MLSTKVNTQKVTQSVNEKSIGKKTVLDSIDAVVRKVSDHAEEWKITTPKERLQKLYEVHKVLQEIHEEYELAGELNRGYQKGDEHYDADVADQSFVTFGIMGGTLCGFIEVYEELCGIRKQRQDEVREKGNCKIVTVVPNKNCEMSQMMNNGVRGELWLKPNTEVIRGAGNMAMEGYDNKVDQNVAPVSVCFSPGNYDACVDVMTSLFRNGRVAVLKTHPRNQEFLLPVYQKLLKPLSPFVEVVGGGLEEGKELLKHKLVGDIIFTGSYHNKKLIEEQVPEKPILSELGGVAPYIIVPSVRKWTEEELRHHAEQLVACKMLNSSHVCASPQILIVERSWSQRNDFIKYVREYYEKAPKMNYFYKGAQETVDCFINDNQFNCQLDIVNEKRNDVSRLLATEVTDINSSFFKKEAFAPVLAEYPVDSEGSAELFLRKITTFCNKQLFGSLSATIIIDKETEEVFKDSLENTISDLNYGTIGVNAFGLMCFNYPALTWGGHPLNSESGEGTLHNTLMYKNVQKSVLRTEFIHFTHLKPIQKGFKEQINSICRIPLFGLGK